MTAATARVAELERTARENRNWREAHATLTERLAQSERERDDLAQMYSTRTRERDDAIKEREAFRHAPYHACTERDAALAKAEIAESELADRIKAAQHYGHEAALAHEQLTDLRARIEALADVEEKDGYTGRAFDLRALLQPTKAETALDVLSKVDAAVGRGDIRPVRDELAKLRKLLEDKQKDPP